MKSQRNLNKLISRFYHGKDLSPDNKWKSNHTTQSLQDYSTAYVDNKGRTSVYFDGIEDVLVQLTQRSEIVVGAVAWLTNDRILECLANVKHAGIVVQKEDFLRRDVDVKSYSKWKNSLRSRYDQLPAFEFEDFVETYPGQQEEHPDFNPATQNWLFDASGGYQFGGSAIRCLGYTSSINAVIPRMHHKFLIFGDKVEGLIMRPHTIATGSFNMTKNATRSRENIVVMENSAICHAYLSEWAQLWSMSEALDWTSKEPALQTIDMST